ncbi:MAG: hypothetical protein ACOYOP_12355, partial [Microthrixaceae bacterium]
MAAIEREPEGDERVPAGTAATFPHAVPEAPAPADRPPPPPAPDVVIDLRSRFPSTPSGSTPAVPPTTVPPTTVPPTT